MMLHFRHGWTSLLNSKQIEQLVEQLIAVLKLHTRKILFRG